MIPAVALGALLLGGPAEPASANHEVGPAAVSLAVDGCPAVSREELARLLALELETPILPPEQAGERAVRVQVGCAGTTVRLAVDDAAKGIQLRRVAVFPPEHEDVMVRLVALAIAELVLTSRVALSFGRAPEGRAEAVAPAVPPSVGARPTGRAYLLAFGQALGPFSGVGLGWGGGLRFGWAFGRRWRAPPGNGLGLGPVVDVEVATAETSVDRSLGTVKASLWSATLRALLRLGSGPAWLDVGGGGRFGLAQLQGEPTDSTSARGDAIAGTWAGPVAYLGLGARVRHMVIELGVEGGRVLRSVSGTVDGGQPISIDGNWACATVAAGWGE
jgi:hypothetical protein